MARSDEEPPVFFDLMTERAQAQAALADLQLELAELVVRYEDEGAVPVEKIRPLVPDVRLAMLAEEGAADDGDPADE